MSQGSLGRNVGYCGLGGHDKATWPTGEKWYESAYLLIPAYLGISHMGKKRCGGHGVGTLAASRLLMRELVKLAVQRV